ncbi:hypothetical protein PC9H_007764 [Pleurotus ostreatus]|uniref:Uncharacterized protein n=2 Tax=Pleurotus ostreatus TaxID=5322 RepID=A0A067NJ09_PLEO1|nr:uncharacterized protein PC9H_007764 [Pleurotus ostreatus]KAF7428540.1 hypothetical protein PC9H_007764 [Pleurotus ostreatus]KDQ28018.1 hypothetical protein PLEOSDRAFT_1104694 [Pleurotus ostreatus PC15]
MADAIKLPNGDVFQLTVPYTAREANGVTALVVISCFSLVAVVGLLGAIVLSAFNTRSWKDQNLFVRTHVAAYFISLLLCDFFQAVGSILGATWIRQMGVHYGSTCVAQGVLKHLSDVGSAVWTLVIATNTFCLLFLEIKLRHFVLWSTLIAGWFGIGAIVIAGPASLNTVKKGPFHAISGYWCWISPEYPAERITLDYMFMFTSAVLSFVIYTLIYLRLRGNLIVNGWHLRFRKLARDSGGDWRGRVADSHTMRISKQMLLVWAGVKVPFEVTIFSGSVFLLSGIVNVILFSTTRRILPPQSLSVGKWRISQPRPLTPPPVQAGVDPYYQESDARSESTKVSSVDEKKLPETPTSVSRHPDSSCDSGGSVYSLDADPPVPPLKVVKAKDTTRTAPPEVQIPEANRASIGLESIYNRYGSPQRSGEASGSWSSPHSAASDYGEPSNQYGSSSRRASQASQWTLDYGDPYGGIIPEDHPR